MVRYFLKRLGMMLVALFMIILLTFVIEHSIPGGPFTSDRKVTPEVEAALNEKYHLNDPLPKQFLDYLVGILHGDLGPSYKYTGKEVTDFISNGFPVSAKLGGITVIFVVLASLPLGILGCSEKWKMAGYAGHGHCDDRSHDSVVCHCFHFDLCIFISAELAADVRTGQLEGLCAPGYYAGRLFRQLSGAPDAFQPAGGDGTGLHPDGPCERALRDKGHFQACIAECTDSCHHSAWTDDRKPADRKLCRRADLCNSGSGRTFCKQCFPA